jgi:uncharacterized protein YgbK (DUF1537 family)
LHCEAGRFIIQAVSTLSELLSDQPPVRRIEGARAAISRDLAATGRRLVVIDDDPTGPQAVHDVRVFMDWSLETLRKVFASAGPVFFISTNSRSLSPEETAEISYEAGRNLREAARLENAEVLLASRSDSTLRGHFPGEVDALVSGLGITPDGIILVPAFFEGGRYTIGDIHYAEQDGEMVPVHLTEFARDPAFGYHTSDLKKWVEEKTGGEVKAPDVLSLSLDMMRNGGTEAVSEALRTVSGSRHIIANAACYEDLEVLALGIAEAERHGRHFVYRCSASFIKARGGFEDRPLLAYRDLAPGEEPGLIIAGSYMEKTSRQLEKLTASGLAEGIELHVDKLDDEKSAEREIRSVSDKVNKDLADGITAAVYTTRNILTIEGHDHRQTGKRIMEALCRVVENTQRKPGFVIAKGGITSIELAKTALHAKETFAIGQILPGVPVWRLSGEARWTDIPYVVFPGNVGDDTAVLRAVRTLKNLPPE